jgi:hypothetical protein
VIQAKKKPSLLLEEEKGISDIVYLCTNIAWVSTKRLKYTGCHTFTLTKKSKKQVLRPNIIVSWKDEGISSRKQLTF